MCKENRDKEIFFTIVMPTYNSERTIGKALKSIREQKFDQDEIEILVIDGGSSDKTIDIANRYKATILLNEKRVPEAAKQLGYRYAKGKWIIKQDSDEVYTNDRQLEKKKQFIEKNPDVYCVLTDKLLAGKKCGISCAYLNYCGDPFSYIVYCLRGSVVAQSRGHLCRQSTYGNVYQYKKGDQYPIGDG
ncbi:MAG: glycosyltransferase, partial [Lachnospiraceae bacterium]|nr:glycosyltransferase [Lachnospiraceae bacterium]